MARENKRGKGKNKAVESVYTAEINENIFIDFYEFANAKKKNDDVRYTAKITLANVFVIFCRVVVMDDYAFLAYPSYKNKKGEYKNLAYCFDKDISEQINEEVNAFIFFDK